MKWHGFRFRGKLILKADGSLPILLSFNTNKYAKEFHAKKCRGRHTSDLGLLSYDIDCES